MRRATALSIMLMLCAQPADAQRARAPLPQLNAQTIVQQARATTAPSSSASFVYEALGGAAGSIAGYALGYALFDDACETDHPTCLLESAAFTLLLSAAGATAGSHIAGRAFNTDPSLTGAALGSLAGALAGVGVWHLVTEDLDIVHDRGTVVIMYGVVHGVVTALGSRLVR